MLRPRLLLLIAAAALPGAVTGLGAGPAAAQLPSCGGLLQPPCPSPSSPTTTATTTTAPPSTATPPPAAPEPAAPISEALFGRIDAYLTALGGDDDATYRRTCTGLPTEDPVLAAIRRRCRQDLKTVGLFDRVQACRSAACARRRIPVFVRELRVEAGTLDALDRAVAAQVPTGACRTAIQNGPENVRQFARLVRGWATIGRAYRQRSDLLLRRGRRQLDAVDFRKGRSLAAQRRAFQASCR